MTLCDSMTCKKTQRYDKFDEPIENCEADLDIFGYLSKLPVLVY